MQGLGAGPPAPPLAADVTDPSDPGEYRCAVPLSLSCARQPPGSASPRGLVPEQERWALCCQCQLLSPTLEQVESYLHLPSVVSEAVISVLAMDSELVAGI
ncbi:hypothetical protein UY3_03325 [Chelonia mydas]|uniref:Uncharacterized protein n=1 Tax=Chelonia mydas TaxID=8469 RepID=M7C4Q6_CHEMY|nr:hypothetical protein UY3_03325 [Chelonia mydas]